MSQTGTTRKAADGRETGKADNETTILIVEDSPTQALSLQNALSKQGYRCTIARDGAEGLAAARLLRPSLIVSDVLMPVMDGFAMCEEIKRDETLEDTPVILLTCLTDSRDVITGLQSGADSFIVKPSWSGQLIPCIEEVLATRRAGRLEETLDEIEVVHGGERYRLTSTSEKILKLLLTVYDSAIHQNRDLTQARLGLERWTEQLEQKVTERTEALTEAHRIAKLGSWQWNVQESTSACSTKFGLLLGVECPDFDASCESLLESAHHDDRAAVAEAFKQALEQQVPFEVEYRVKRCDDETIWVHARGIPAFDTGGKLVRVVGTLQDITERKRVEDELRKYRDELEVAVAKRTLELEKANEELERFAYSLAHDLRGPLRAIDGFASILRADYSQALDSEGNRLVDVVCDNTRHMAQLIEDMLELSVTGRRPLETVEIDMKELVEGELEKQRQQQSGRSFEGFVADLPHAQADVHLVRQVWANLLSNAIKFCRSDQAAEIRVSGSAEGDWCSYRISDNGVGFDIQHVDQLFGAFQRLHAPNEFEGTGVGLAIVQRAVERHGGRVWAEGAVNSGATFHFTLPAVGGTE